MAWWLSLLIGILLSVVSYLLTPRPKQPQPEAVKDLEDPTAEAGRPIPVLFGTMTIKSLNCIWFGDKGHAEYEIQV